MLCFECENIRGILEIGLIFLKAMRINTRVVQHIITYHHGNTKKNNEN